MIRNVFTALILCLLAACAVSAPLNDNEQPIKVQANSMTYDQAKNLTVLEGNVDIEQGTIRIQAQRVNLIQAANGYNTIKATGKPVAFEGRSEKTNRQVKGWANQIEYEEKTESVIMTGDARLISENDEIQAQTIRYFRKTGQYFADGSNKPVFAVIQPRKKEK